MDVQNSQASKYTDLCVSVIGCNPLSASRSKSLLRDEAAIRSRVTKEGISFLTKTLPKLGKALDLGLECSKFSLPREFSHSHGNRNIPALLQEYFNLVFDQTGALLENACPYAIRHIRQVCFLCYKLEFPFSEDSKNDVLSSFVSTDETLTLEIDAYSENLLRNIRLLISYIFRSFDPKDIKPRHGPGAVATGEKHEQKWKFSRLYDSIHQYYPYYEYFVVSTSHLSDSVKDYMSLSREKVSRAKVILVPKDSRGPRLISSEPLETQWIQQGLGRKFMSHLEGNSLTGGHVNFQRQSVNQALALSSSMDREHACLDLKDASDRVSLAFVRAAFSREPELLRAMEACRSAETTLPSGSVVELKKFAPMGSALCFPVESLLFFSICVSAISVRWRLPLSESAKLVYVYGDDIIVPTAYADQCILALERFGLMVNRSKCGIRGFFRESCGTDAFKGVVITPIRLKTLWSDASSDGSVLTAYTSIANKLFAQGYFAASTLVWEWLDTTFGVIPFGVSTSPFPCRVSPCAVAAEKSNLLLGFKWRWNKFYQSIEFQVKHLRTRRSQSILDSWPRLMRDLVMPPFDDPSVVVLSRSTLIKRGWAQV